MKLKLAGCLLFIAGLSHAEVLTQQAYDQKIQQHMQVIQHTKAILDQPDSQADAKQQSQALCERLSAYEQIALLSKENPSLEMASVMLMASQNFLDRQKASLGDAGMTASVFCAGKTPAQ